MDVGTLENVGNRHLATFIKDVITIGGRGGLSNDYFTISNKVYLVKLMNRTGRGGSQKS